MREPKTPPWKKANPKGQTSQPLSTAQKEAARQRAEENGRRYLLQQQPSVGSALQVGQRHPAGFPPG